MEESFANKPQIAIGVGDISVVIPLYNDEHCIADVLDSINNQEEREYIGEIVVIDDGSTDSSASVVESYSAYSSIPIRLIRQENHGVSHARNVGMREARGRWIAFCDSDDLWLREKTAIQTYVINSIEVDLLGANWLERDLVFYGKRLTELRRMTVEDLCVKMLVQTSTVLMKKSIFEEIGGFNEDQSYAEDGNYILNIAARYKAYYLPVQVVYYGGGKRGFGVSGLSANMPGMYRGNVRNLKEMKEKGYIGSAFYIRARAIQYMKYLRRKLIVAATPSAGD